MKRLNPETNKPYKRGEEMSSGKVFWGYSTDKDNDGFFYIRTVSDKNTLRSKKDVENSRPRNRANEKALRMSREYKKRVNPATKQIFKFGEGPNENGLYFLNYDIRRENTEYENCAAEVWTDKQTIDDVNEKAKASSKLRYETNKAALAAGTVEKRKNKKTEKEFVRGDIRNDGMIFSHYDIKKNFVDDKYVFEVWFTAEEYHQDKVKRTVSRLRKRAGNSNLEFALSYDYLISIFPEDFICPVLGIKMSWNNDDPYNLSPSVDKFFPEQGYVEGNVAWISNKANRLKSDVSFKEIDLLHRWMELKIKKNP